MSLIDACLNNDISLLKFSSFVVVKLRATTGFLLSKISTDFENAVSAHKCCKHSEFSWQIFNQHLIDKNGEFLNLKISKRLLSK